MRLARAIGGFLLAAAGASAADVWIKLKTERFELYTTAGERRGRELLEQFERIHGFFSKDARNAVKPMLPARIVAFKSRKEFEQFRPNEVAAAFYMQGADAHYVAMQATGEERVAYHEFVHLLMAHNEMKLPVWFGEGFAELYSTMKPIGKKVEVGHLIGGHFVARQQEKWIPVRELTQAEHDSPLYNRKNHAGAFYAESWALMHMLNLSEPYRPGFVKFFREVLSGASSMNAFQTVYGKTPEHVDRDLQAYFRSDRFFAGIFDEPLASKVAIAPALQAEPLEVGLVLANLLVRESTRDRAKTRYEALSSEFPNSPEPFTGLGYLEWRANNRAGASEYFARALRLGSENRKMLCDLATLSQGSDAAISTEAAERLLALDPGHTDARILLGYHYLKSGKHKEAFAILSEVKTVTPERARNFLSALAHAADRSGNPEKALSAARQLLSIANDTESRIQASQLIDYLTKKKDIQQLAVTPTADQSSRVPFSGNPAPTSESRRYAQPTGEIVEETVDVERSPAGDPLQKIDGRFVQLDCASGKAILHLSYAGKPFPLMIEQPDNLVVKNLGTSQRMDLECGPQQPARLVTVQFVPKEDTKTGTKGVLWRIAFQ